MYRKFKNFLHLIYAWYWVVRCGWPGKRLYVIGVTGTDGKTTTCALIYEILRAAGIQVGMITTIGAKMGQEEIETGLHTTNPGPELLQPLLRTAVDKGITHMVLEVTSHGLDQNRVAGCDFKIGVLTNITHEHLDYHGNMEDYRNTKLKLFMFPGIEYSVLNEDDESFNWFKAKSRGKIITYRKSDIKNVSPVLAGDYNRYNIAAATEVAKILKIQDSVVRKVVENFTGVPGRREEVKTGQGFRVVVDFAHTPNALEQVLTQLKREAGKNKLLLVFGCTGERDKAKRPIMGEIAQRLADTVIVTSDDVRGEDQNEITRQILAGTKNPEKILIENDRRTAIGMAIKLAKDGDIVLLAGKGHEKTILIGKKELPWSDAKVAGEILQRQFS